MIWQICAPYAGVVYEVFVDESHGGQLSTSREHDNEMYGLSSRGFEKNLARVPGSLPGSAGKG